jgi:hypothetical protein
MGGLLDVSLLSVGELGAGGSDVGGGGLVGSVCGSIQFVWGGVEKSGLGGGGGGLSDREGGVLIGRV